MIVLLQEENNMNIEHVRRRRIRITIAAYIYEATTYAPIMSDSEYDALASIVEQEKHIETGDKKYDTFFATEYSAYTGMWIRRHPDFLSRDNKLNNIAKYIVHLFDN